MTVRISPGERTEGGRADVALPCDRQQRGRQRFVVGCLDRCNHVVRAERPPDVGEADAEILERILRGFVAVDGVLEVTDALVGPVDQRDVRGHLVLPSWGDGHADEEPLATRHSEQHDPNRRAVGRQATSREAFAEVYDFLTGAEPEAADVVPEPPGQVTVAGRAALFPANTGYEGAVLRIYEVRAETGARKEDGPVHSVTLGPDGSFGPFKLNGKKHYEFAVSKDGELTLHNYPEPFERDDHFFRVLNAPGLSPFITKGPNHSVVTVTRMREWWGNQAGAASNDKLELNGLNVINPAIAPRARRVLAVFNFDSGSDGVTNTSAALFPFSVLSFLTGVDNFLPASPDASGTVAVKETMRGSGHVETINVPNWPSDQHTSSVYFRDYVAKTFPAGR